MCVCVCVCAGLAQMDSDCGGYLNSNLASAIYSGAVSNATVNEALYHLFAVQFRLGIFDPAAQQPYTQYGECGDPPSASN